MTLDGRHKPLGWATSIISKSKLLSWYCIEQLAFESIKGPGLKPRCLCNTVHEGIIGELQRFEVVVEEEFEYAARVANPDLGDRDGLSLLLGCPFVLRVGNHNWVIFAEVLTSSIHIE